MEPVTGVGPATIAWQATILPLNYTDSAPTSKPCTWLVATTLRRQFLSSFRVTLRQCGYQADASLGHMHKLSHGPAEVRDEN